MSERPPRQITSKDGSRSIRVSTIPCGRVPLFLRLTAVKVGYWQSQEPVDAFWRAKRG